MNTIRKFAYATVLTLSALNFAPGLASAQDAAGTFTLSHEVHWQNAVVPAGTYRFTIASDGPANLLTLRSSRAGFVMLVTDTEDSKRSDLSRVVLVSRPQGSFVSAMQLPQFGMTLHFVVPEETREVAQAVATSAASAAR
jgi:hypothetical protein